VFTFGDFQSSSDVEGRLFVGGNAKLADGFSVGDKLKLNKCKGPGMFFVLFGLKRSKRRHSIFSPY
jgi:choice-of-anchor A domain-containing protein